MAFDMESEFYKLAKDILSKPQNLYKMTGISPKDGRLSLIGAEGFLVVPRRHFNPFCKGTEERAYKAGVICGKDTFGGLLKEFDEEIMELSSRKLLELGLMMSRLVGWGTFEVESMREERSELRVIARSTLELGYKDAMHHSLTCGFLSGVASEAFRKPMRGAVIGTKEGSVIFDLSPE